MNGHKEDVEPGEFSPGDLILGILLAAFVTFTLFAAFFA